jgi:hypothetical protein
VFVHADCEGEVAQSGTCLRCGDEVPLAETVMTPGPGLTPPSPENGQVSALLARPHRLLQPVH